MFQTVRESTLEAVMKTFEGIKEAFLEAKGDVFLPTAKLIGKKSYVGAIILRSLVADNMLESKVDRSHSPNFGGRPLTYKPTQGGWELLTRAKELPAIDLYKRYMDLDRAKKGALPKETTHVRHLNRGAPKPGVCVVCQDGIMSRRVDATVCWGCEEMGERMKRGMDHVPRTSAYLKMLRPRAAQAERARVDAVIAQHRQGVRKDNRNAANGVPQDRQVPLPSDRRQLIGQALELGTILERLRLMDDKINTLMRQLSHLPKPKLTNKQRAIAAAKEALAKAQALED